MEIKLINIRSLLRMRYLMTIMKLFIFLMCTTVFSLSTESVFSQEKVVIEKDQVATANHVFKIIKKQTNYNFLYPKSLFKNSPKIELKKGEIDVLTLVDKVLKPNRLEFELTSDNTIVLNKVKAQKMIQISGTIVDEEGQPIPGVSIIVKSSGKATVSDFDGNYRIKVASAAEVLTFSSIGFATQEVIVGAQKQIDVTLVTDVSSLDEVIVVGYGTAKKETLTGAVEQVKAEAFEDLAVGSAELALQGRTPGITVTRTSSRPGNEEIDINVRGATSINNEPPLIVIDGVPAIENAFSNMNPNDIESVSVLKGASASVYGSRAASGVILVTTKKGKSGKVKVDVSSVLRIGTIGIRPPSPTMSQYGQLYLNAVNEDLATGIAPNYFFWNSVENLERIAAGEEGEYNFSILGDVYLQEGNMFDEMFGTSYSSQQNVTISGGTDKSNYRLSGSFDDNIGGLQTADDSAKRYNLSFVHNYKVNDNLDINTNVSYFHKHFSGPSGGLDREATTYDAPLFGAKNQYGQWYGNFGGNIAGARNAIARVTDGGRENEIDTQLKIITTAKYKLNDQFNISGTYSYTKANSDDQIYALTVPTYNWYGDVAPAAINSTSYIQEERGVYTHKLYRAALNYDNTFGKHHVSSMIAVDAEKFTRNSLRARRNGFEDFGVYDLDLGATDQEVQTEGGGTTSGFYSTIGRVNYAYDGKYLFEAQGRMDGTSRFSDGNKDSQYANVSAGWILSKENFLKDNGLISFLKLRAGYGELGSTSDLDDFGFLSTVTFGNTVFGTTGSQQVTSYADKITSNETTWERIATTEAGVDFRLFNNRLFGSFDVYKKENTKMLIRTIETGVMGDNDDLPDRNVGSLEAKGWEVQLGWKDQIGDFSYSVAANMSDSRNEVTSYGGGGTAYEGFNDVEDARIKQGDPINSYYLYKTDGVFANQAEVDAYTSEISTTGNFPNVDLRPGDTRIVDVNGDGQINNLDITYQGEDSPHYMYGLNLDFKYKNWDLSAFFQGVLNQDVLRTGYFSRPFIRVWQNQSNTWLDRTWTEENPNAEFPRLTTNSSLSSWNYNNKDFMLQNNRYVRLKSLIVGYTLRDLNVGNTAISSLRLYFSGNDLFEFTEVKDGWDPESQANSNASAYPFMRTWAFGIKLSI